MPRAAGYTVSTPKLVPRREITNSRSTLPLQPDGWTGPKSASALPPTISGLTGGRRVALLGHRARGLDEIAKRVLTTNLIVTDAFNPALPEGAEDGPFLREFLLVLFAHPAEFCAQILVVLDRCLRELLDLLGRRAWWPLGERWPARHDRAIDREDEAGPEVRPEELAQEIQMILADAG